MFFCDVSIEEGFVMGCVGFVFVFVIDFVLVIDLDVVGGDVFDLVDVGLFCVCYVCFVDCSEEYYGLEIWCVVVFGGFDFDVIVVVEGL